MKSLQSYQKIACILRADQKDFLSGAEMLAKKTAKNISTKLREVIEQNKSIIDDRLKKLGVGGSVEAKVIYSALLAKARKDDSMLKKFFYGDGKNIEIRQALGKLIQEAFAVVQPPKGFFLKKDKARELLLSNPPLNILKILGYSSVEQMLAKEDLLGVFCALRFAEDGKWLNEVFFKPYSRLRPTDFEEREIVGIVVDDRFRQAAQEFTHKKYHNVSHLKELGVVFVIPIKLNYSGATLRTFSLLLHYLHEVAFYSQLFQKYATDEVHFAERFLSSLRGDVVEEHIPQDKIGRRWLIVQRYLAKIDPYDWRLSYPHINPEAIHWTKAQADLSRFFTSKLGKDAFWDGIDWVGDYFKDELGIDILVSFNLVDAVMSLADSYVSNKYIYHQHEALWNYIFGSFIKKEEMEEVIVNNLEKGFVDIF